MNTSDLVIVFNAYINYSKLLQSYKMRRPNFPEGLSETLAGHLLSKHYSKKIMKAKCGDLIDENKFKYEIKCFSSVGPTSFGPTESWDSLVFVVFIDYENGNFSIYEFPYSNTSNEIQNLNISKKETYQFQCSKGRRPRIRFNEFIIYTVINYNKENSFGGQF